MADLYDIEKEAQKIVRKAPSLAPPIDVTAIINETWPKIFIGAADLGDYHGALVTEGGRVAMYYSQKASPEHTNIILAHLTWHWVKHSLKGQIDITRQCLVYVARPEDPLAAAERDADVFAAELLVPLEVLEKYIDFSPDPQTEQERALVTTGTVELARRFAVPVEVMKARLTLFAARRRSFRPKGWKGRMPDPPE